MNTNLWLCHILSEKHHKTLSPELCKHFQSQISRRSSFMRSINTRPLGMTGLFSSAWSSSLLPSRPVDVTLPPPPPETSLSTFTGLSSGLNLWELQWRSSSGSISQDGTLILMKREQAWKPWWGANSFWIILLRQKTTAEFLPADFIFQPLL